MTNASNMEAKHLYAMRIELDDPKRQARMNAAAEYMQHLQQKNNLERNDWLRRQIEEKEY